MLSIYLSDQFSHQPLQPMMLDRLNTIQSNGLVDSYKMQEEQSAYIFMEPTGVSFKILLSRIIHSDLIDTVHILYTDVLKMAATHYMAKEITR